MKKNILSLIIATVLLHIGTASAATTPQITFTQTTNAVLTWPSTPGDTFMVLHRRAFHPSTPWKILATNLSAGPFNLTTFTHVGAFRVLTGPVLSGGGGGGSPPGSPAAATLAAPTTDTTTTTDKVKKNDAPPALPDEKELEKLYRDWLKEWEKLQKNNGGGNSVQTFSAAATYTLPDASYTNFTGGFYVITRTTDDTDADGLPDWWEAANGLALLVDDAQADPDNDGVPNLAEYAYGTNPRDPNSKPVVYVSYTSPVNTSTYYPVVQLTGSINLNIRTLFFDVTNAAGVQTGLEGFVTRRTVVPGPGFTNSPARYTNSFQCFDVPLTNGANTVGLRFTDAYGLTFATTVSFTVDFNASPAAPVGTVFWPASGTKLGTDAFTLRGRLDNPTATVVARMTIDGEVQEIGGLVERDGTFWIEDLPTPASGPVTLVFTDAGGKARTNTLNLSRSPVSLHVYDPSGPNLWDQTTTLYGTVSDAAHSVWVNSIRATVDENGNWYAENVPMNAGGVASIALRAVPNSDNGGAGSGGAAMSGSGGQGGLYTTPTGNPGSANAVDAAFDFDKPPRIVVASYTLRSQDDNPTFESGHTNRQTLDWTRSGAGYSGNLTSLWEMKYPNFYTDVWRQTQTVTYPFPGTTGYELTTGIYTWGDPFSYTNLTSEPSIPWEQASAYLRTADRNFTRKAETQLSFQTGGRGAGRTTSIFEFGISVSATDALGNPLSVLPEQVSLFGEVSDANFIVLKADLPMNTTLDATPIVLLAANAAPGGVMVNYGFGSQSSVLQAISPVRYANPYVTNGVIRTNYTQQGSFYLGYGSAYVLYAVRQNETLDGILHQVRNATSRYSLANLGQSTSGKSIRFDWGGVVPPAGQPLPVFMHNPPVLNSRRYANPNTTYSAEAKHWRYNLYRTNTLGTIRMTAKAVVARSGAGNSTHLGDIASPLSAMGYTVETDNSLTAANIANRTGLGLVWYSITHGQASDGNFVGPRLDGVLLPATQLPPGLNYSLVFLNGCFAMKSGDGGTGPQAFASGFGATCYVGWSGAVDPPIALEYAKRFFAHLGAGISVTGAITAVNNSTATAGQGTLGDMYASNDINVFPKVKVKDNISLLGNGAMIIDLR